MIQTGQLIFYYGPMNCGKSMHLLAKAHSLDERNIPYRIFKSSLDDRDGSFISSRAIADKKECTIIDKDFSFLDAEDFMLLRWILVDEAQFLTEKQVDELAYIADNYGTNVACYGIRTDFKTHLFEGSRRLFEVGDVFSEISSECKCGKKNIFNARVDSKGKLVIDGEQINTGAEDKYKTICRKCYYDALNNKIKLTKR